MLPPEIVPELAAFKPNIQNMVVTAMGLSALLTSLKAFAIVHQGEAGVKTRRGGPSLKSEYKWLFKTLEDRPLELTEDELQKANERLERFGYRDLSPEQIALLSDEELEGGIYKIRNKRGIVPLVPFIDHCPKINIRDRAKEIELPVVSVNERNQKEKHEIKATVGWFVRPDGDNPYKARFNLNNERDNKDKDKDLELETKALGIFRAGLGRVLSNKSSDELIEINHRDPEGVTEQAKIETNERLLPIGVALRDVDLEPITPVDARELGRALKESKSSEEVQEAAAASRIISKDAAAKDGTGNVYFLSDFRDDAA
jgi:hypothetical protein